MPRVVSKQLAFPMAGVSRRGEYREMATPPYATPWALNVRGESPIERRKRGGSRPGLVKYLTQDFGTTISAIIPVTSVDSSQNRHQDLIVVADGTCYSVRSGALLTLDTSWQTAIGEAIQTASGDAIEWDSTVSATVNSAVERGGMLYLVDSGLKSWNPTTGIVATIVATDGAIPTGCKYACLYRDRLFLYGEDHVWYCSRQGDLTDWGLSRDMGDVGRAIAGQIDRAGRIGEPITAMIPNNDQSMLISTKNGMWLLRGDPTDGSISLVSEEIGAITNTAWARAPNGLVAFLSNDGVYVVGGDGSPPVKWSTDRVPDELRAVNTSTNTISMAYEAKSNGFHLFVTPSTGVGTHWFMDADKKAIWPVMFADEHQPLAAARIASLTGDLSDVVLGCKDGILRKFDDLAEDDDGISIQSHVLLGPIKLSSNEMEDAVLSEIHGVLADNSGTVTWRVVTGKSAEEATDAAVDGIDAVIAGSVGTYPKGDWKDNRNLVEYPRARGPWAIIWLASKARWAYDSVTLRINQLGRLR